MNAEVEQKVSSIYVSENAAKEVKRLIKEEDRPDTAGVKVGVAGGGCSGLTYKLDFTDGPADNDRTFEDKGVKLFVDLKSFIYLQGTMLDFSSGLSGKGFLFKNPNASRTCGCGESFSV